jgi:hypothetical protein
MGITTIQALPAPQGMSVFSLETTPQYIAGWHAWTVDVTGNVISEFDSAAHDWDLNLPATGTVVVLVRFTGKYDGVHPYQQVYSQAVSTGPALTFAQFGTIVKTGAIMTPAQYQTVLNTAMPKNPNQ